MAEGITVEGAVHWNSLGTEQQIKVLTAIEALLNNDPNLPELLTKLAELKIKKPLIYKMAVAKLKKM